MHVLVTADAIGGVWTYIRELVTGLVRRGFRVTLVSFGDLPTAEQTEWMSPLDIDFRPTAFRLEWMQRAERDFAASVEYLERVIDEVRPDLLHCNQFGFGVAECSIPRIIVAHSDVLSWWRAARGEEPPALPWLRWYRHTVQEGLAGADVVVAPSRWMLETIERLYGKPHRAEVIYNGRNPALFNALLTKDEFVLTVGRLWDEAKQARLLAEAESSVPVYIAGNERHPDDASRVGLGELDSGRPLVCLKGRQSELQLMQLYSRAAIYAATSCYEPFGLAPVEAALSRCALLCNDIPVFRELWDGAALFFDLNDAYSLRRAIERLHGDRELRREYANRAYTRARERFTADRMVEDYLALYRSMVPAEVAA